MIEVLVTVVIIAIGLLGIAAMQSVSMKSSLDSAQRAAASNLGYELISRLRANPTGARSGAYTGAFANANICNAAPAVICSDYYDQQGGAVNAVAACSAAELAAYDAWEMSCGFNNEDDTFSSPINYLLAPEIDVTCADSDGADADACSENSQYTITFTWRAIAPSAPSDNQVANPNAVTEHTLTLTPFI